MRIRLIIVGGGEAAASRMDKWEEPSQVLRAVAEGEARAGDLAPQLLRMRKYALYQRTAAFVHTARKRISKNIDDLIREGRFTAVVIAARSGQFGISVVVLRMMTTGITELGDQLLRFYSPDVIFHYMIDAERILRMGFSLSLPYLKWCQEKFGEVKGSGEGIRRISFWACYEALEYQRLNDEQIAAILAVIGPFVQTPDDIPLIRTAINRRPPSVFASLVAHGMLFQSKEMGEVLIRNLASDSMGYFGGLLEGLVIATKEKKVELGKETLLQLLYRWHHPYNEAATLEVVREHFSGENVSSFPSPRDKYQREFLRILKKR